MHFSNTAVGFVATIFALGQTAFGIPAVPPCPTPPIDGRWYLTVVPSNGSTDYPANIAVVSRGAHILSSAVAYGQQFGIEPATNLLYGSDEPKLTSGHLTPGLPVLFEGSGGDALEQIQVDCKVYLVKEGAGPEGLNSWTSQPSASGLPREITWSGAGATAGNVALRIDNDIPTARRK